MYAEPTRQFASRYPAWRGAFLPCTFCFPDVINKETVKWSRS